jgi:adenylate kinase family enzyme
MPEKVKRLRVLAGPNGSGKSTVALHILSNYHCGHFLNADELHKPLEQKNKIEFSSFGLTVSQNVFDDYLATVGKSWLEKANREGEPIYLKFTTGGLIVAENPGLRRRHSSGFFTVPTNSAR